MRSVVRPLTAGALGLGALLLGAGPALAVEPFAPMEQLVDQADVLSSSEEAEVTDALAQLQSENGTQLYVVYVDDFGELTSQQWTEAAYDLRGMGSGDVILAVATETREIGYGLGPGTSLSGQDELAELVTTQVEPQLSDGDYTAAAVTLAEELQDTGSGGGAALGVLAAIALVGGGGYALMRSRQRKKRQAAQQQAAAERAAAEAAARDPHHG
ncbi:TPM domain-containing protein, partial [Modestobacter roseus]|uniref:TPM domain-containing protein n=1 Tax=Modestobacter roseus TaxID=1181884 RepID=UPI0013225F09